MIKKTIVLFFVSVVLITVNNEAQIKLHAAGASMGVGTISGNSPQIFSYSLSLFSDFTIQFSNPTSLRLEIIYASDFNSLIPSNRQNEYSPSLKGGSLQMLFRQKWVKQFFFEEGCGPLILNDRTFSDVNTWNYGGVFSFALGINFFNNGESGFSLAVFSEFGITFTQTTPQYLFVGLQSNLSL